MDASEPKDNDSPRAGSRWFHAALLGMLVAFAAVVLNRHEIRATWWGYQLASSDEQEREQAGLCLAFMTHPAGTEQLLRASQDDNPRRVEAAVAALAHLSCEASLESLCRVTRSHPDARVRAQAIESIMIRIREDMRGTDSSVRPPSHDEPIRVLREARSDAETFSGLLAYECQIESASRMAGHPPTSMPATRTVGGFAEMCMAQIEAILADQTKPMPSDRPSGRQGDDTTH
jgi:hypothetical protein